MKSKIYRQLLVLPLIAIAVLFALNQCKKVGPSDWPEPDANILNQFKISAINSETGEIVSNYQVNVILPDGTTKEFPSITGTLTFEGTKPGIYVITAEKEGFLSESTILEVTAPEMENYSTVVQHVFLLNKRGNANIIPVQGTTIQVQNDTPVPTVIQFPAGALNNDQNLTVTFIQPPAKNQEFLIMGEHVIVNGYHFAPDLTFPANAKPTITIPVNVPSVLNGESDIWIGNYNAQTGTWEKIKGELNADRTRATFVMPHFSTWFVFTGYRLIKDSETWSPWVFVAESSTCSAGVCGTFHYAVTPNALVNHLISIGYNINLKVKDTRCVGPHYKYAQQLFARVLLVTYKVYDYTGAYVGSIQLPTKKIQWMVDEYYCHDQGGNP